MRRSEASDGGAKLTKLAGESATLAYAFADDATAGSAAGAADGAADGAGAAADAAELVVSAGWGELRSTGAGERGILASRWACNLSFWSSLRTWRREG